MFKHSPSNVLVVTDTLATSDGEPLMFQSKVRPFPHANMIVAGTGVADVVSGWVHFLSTQALFRDVRGADVIATQTLRRLHREVVGDLTGPNLTTTIYHFGFERGSDTAVRYVYRSTKDYVVERVEEPGFGVKPFLSDAPPYEAPEDMQGFVALAERIRAEQATQAEPIYVGGELHLTALNSGGVQILRLHEFEDFEDNWRAAMLRTANPFG